MFSQANLIDPDNPNIIVDVEIDEDTQDLIQLIKQVSAVYAVALTFLLGVFLLPQDAVGQTGDRLSGNWAMEDGTVVQIVPCEGVWCGILRASPPRDAFFEDNQIGDLVLQRIQPDGDEWSGVLWFAEDAPADVGLRLNDPNTLRVRGYLLMLCETEILTRVN